MTSIGFIGLGHMGGPMAANCLKAGHTVKVLDLVPEAVEKLVADGATAAKNVADACTDTEFVITMLQTGDQVRKICEGPDGIFKHISRNTVFIDASTIDITTCQLLHAEAEQQGLAMLDAPVSGGVGGATTGTLTFMIGGCNEYFHIAEPLLEAMGRNIIHAGPPCAGQAAKICNNMILGVSMIAISEAFMLGDKLGLDPKKLFEISSKASGQCWSMTSYSPIPDTVPSSPANNDFEPGFTVEMMLKDLYLSQQAAKQASSSTPMGAAATSLYEAYAKEGNEQLDFSAIIKSFQRGEDK